MGNNKGKTWDAQKRKEYDREYRRRNKTKRNEYGKQWHFTKAFNGMREVILERDNWACVKCGMSQEQHILVFNRAITIDHINKDRNNNSKENLQTLCLRCHVLKDNQDNFFKRRLSK